MILRAQAVGEYPSVRFVIRNLRSNLMWDGESFVDDFDLARKYAHPSNACAEIQNILKDHYGQLPKRRFVVPVEIKVYGSVNRGVTPMFYNLEHRCCKKSNETILGGTSETKVPRWPLPG